MVCVCVWCAQPAAELRQWNKAEVVYEALFKHLYTTDAAVIQVSLSCHMTTCHSSRKQEAMQACVCVCVCSLSSGVSWTCYWF